MPQDASAHVTAEHSPAPHAIPAGLADRLVRRAITSPSADTYDCVTPMTGKVLATVPQSSVENVELAYKQARASQRRWASLSVQQRARFLGTLHDLVLRHQDQLMDLIQLESGKARMHAFDEVIDVLGTCRHYKRKAPSYLAPQRQLGAIPVLSQSRVRRLPKGVVGIVAPWNYPLSMSITDALPALVAGNAVVLRPDNRAILTALYVVELADKAGLPEGVLQVVLGDGASIGAAVLERADYVMFTGSTRTGRTVAAQAGERLVGASLELGGKNPMYVADDANLKKAADIAVRAMFSSGGQLCISIERLLLHEKIADEFLEIFARKVKEMKIGPQLEFGYQMGSLISPEQLATVTEHVDDAVAKGAKLLAGGKARPDLGPYFYEPTVLDGVDESMTVCRNETFGPVVSVYRVHDDAEAVRIANDTDFGLNASVLVGDTRRGRRIANQIKAGTVNVNDGFAAAWASYGSPMGGMKQSGLGRRHGAEGIQKYTELQNVTVQHLMPIAPPPGVSEKTFAKVMSFSLKAMKKGGLS